MIEIIFLYLITLNGIESIVKQVPPERRIDCLPKPGADKATCLSHKCIWDDEYYSDTTIPACYFPSDTGYIIVQKSNLSLKLQKTKDAALNPYGTDVPEIAVQITNSHSVLNVRIGVKGRYEPTVPLPRACSSKEQHFTTEIPSESELFTLRIRRITTGQLIWDTSIGGLLFADQYIQIATFLSTDKIYGFGEHVHPSLKHKFTKYTTWPMFARDQPPDPENPYRNLYGVHPFYLGLEKDNNAHGVLLWNSNPQEITTGPGPHLIYRFIGGIIDATFFPGPKPEQVIQQYLEYIGRPFLPAYFALGFQFCRYGYKSLTEMKETIEKIENSSIPIDVVYADIDYMERYKDFTVAKEHWSNFKEYADELHKNGMHLLLIFDPAVQVNYSSFQRAIEKNASFIEWENYDQVQHEIQNKYPLIKDTKIMLSVVWPDWHVAFPDFLDPEPSTAEWWIEEFKRFHQMLPFDGIWIDMNEPAAFGTNEYHPFYFDDPDRPAKIIPLKCPLNDATSKYDNPPYETWNSYAYNFAEAHLSNKTVCMSGMTNRGTQRIYNTKNLYGLAEMIATEKAQHAATGKRGLILSRSTFVSSGHYGGHWLGDNSARWIDLRASIIGIQEFNLFGMPYIGADICGFNGETTEELCLRWQQLGAFYPFSRNHNEKGVTSQDPSRWPDVARATRNANLFRYYYLPYLYSLLFDVSLYGGTVIRPVFFEFTSDSETHDLGEQFMWGNAMMIIPVYQPGATSVSGYLPSAIWYSLRDSDYGTLIKSGHNEFRAPRDELIPVFVKGPGKSTGMLYWYDGESIVKDFTTYNYFYWLFEFVLNADTAIMYITSNCTADYFTMASVSATNELSTISDGDDLRTYVVYNDERRNVNSIIGLYPLINYSVQNNDNIDRLPFFGIRQCLQLQNAYKNYGMVRTIKAVLLGHKNSTVYVLILKNGADEAQNWSKLPTVSLYPDEDEIDGMKRLLVQVMGLTEESAEAICKVRHVVAKWWRPNFEKEIYPYIPSHITKPKEMIKLIAVNLPKSAVFTIPKNSLLIAAPLFEIYDNVNEYGAIIANLPHVLGRFEFIYNP